MTIQNRRSCLLVMFLCLVFEPQTSWCEPGLEVAVQASYSGESSLNWGQYTDSASGSSPEEITTHVNYYNSPYTLNSSTRVWTAAVGQALHVEVETRQNTFWNEGGTTRAMGGGTLSVTGADAVRVVGEIVLNYGGSGPPHPIRSWDFAFVFGDVSFHRSGMTDLGTNVERIAIDERICVPEQGPFGTLQFDLMVTSPGAGHGHCNVSLDIEFIGERSADVVYPFEAALIGCGPAREVETWEDERGNRFALRCEQTQCCEDPCNEFRLYYIPHNQNEVLVGRCPWCGGQNEALIMPRGKKNEEGKYACFEYSTYTSREPWPSDNPGNCGDQGCQGVIDWIDAKFTVSSGELLSSYAWKAPPGHGVWQKNPVRTQTNLATFRCPDEVNCGRAAGANTGASSRGDDDERIPYPFERCDTDFDGDCDADDFHYACEAIGTSYGEENYIFMADLNRNDSVTIDDLFGLFPRLGDFDQDGDVDLADHLVLTSCFGGPGVLLDSECQYADLDCDHDSDLADFRVFQIRFTGD